MKKFLLSIALALSVALGAGGLAVAQSPTDAAKNEVCRGIDQSGGACGGGDADVQNVLRLVLQLLSWVAGIAAVIMIVLSGLKFITAQGDSSGVASAKSSLIYALVGLVIVAVAQVIVQFVLSETTQ